MRKTGFRRMRQILGKAVLWKVISEVLKALVIVPNPRTREIGDLLAVARAEARKREHTQQNPPVRALKYFPELGVYVAVYETQDPSKKVKEQSG